ncbi:phage tail protein [Lactiplantibacillus plantarum]|uniref:phage tail protein n=1 Tax=Lactiplantibacillus plantarum TaxID=1590 RepID=UPI002014FB1E|nr:phage tail protein [Lactiplantibacillus plantarum]
MIKFHDPAGTPHFGQATITRTTSVNGGLSLTGEVFAGGDVLNGLDYGWWLNFDNEKYVITYKKLSDDTNTVVFDAVQQFFWDFAKVALHAQYTGSHEYTFYLGQLFNESGYTYKNDVTVPAFEKENWGYKNKLDLFNDIIDQAGVEFEVHNETVHIAKQIGSDLTSFARKGINLSDLTEEMKISDFATYAKGYGAFKDAEDQSKGRLEVEYRSELAKQFGDLEMDPIVDERYTIADNLIAALKKQVDATYTVSMTMNIYDLENAGYPNYEAPKVGDWILAIDEALNFKRKIRIIQLEEQFDVTGKRIGYTATCGDLSIVDQYTHLQSSLDSKVQRIQESVDSVAISADGKSSNYYGAKEPINANEGDLWFDQSNSDPDKWSIKQWANGRWEQLTLNPGEVDAKVDVAKQEAETAIENAKSASDKAARLAAKYDDTNALANQAMDKAVGAQSDASSAIATANSTASGFGKVDQKADSALTAALNAQTNASTAVSQASSAAADSKDAKQIAGAVSQSYKTLTDGSTMTIAELENGLATKLTKTDLDGYATQSWTQNQIKVTADGINATLSSVKTTVDSQTTSINDLKADSSSFKSQFTTVNNTLGKQTTDIGTLQTTSKELTTGFNTLTTDNGTNKNDISQLKQTATEVSTTLETVQTQVQNSAVGTNLLTGTADKILTGTFTGGFVSNENNDDFLSLLKGLEGEVVTISVDYEYQGFVAGSAKNRIGWEVKLFTDSNTRYFGPWYNIPSTNSSGSGRISSTFVVPENITSVESANGYIQFSGSGTGTVSHLKLEKGSLATDWCPNPADNATVTAVSKLSQTVDSMKADISKKIEQKDLNGYATETWTQNQINLTSDSLSGTLSSVKNTVDGHTTSINDLQADSSGFKAQFTTVNNTLGKQNTDISTLQATSKSLGASFDSLSSDNATNKHNISQLQASATTFNSTLMTVQTQIQNSAVGTNLYTDTRDFDNPNGIWNRYDYWTKTGEIYNGMTAVSTTKDWDGLSQTWAVKKGETYTFSIYAKYESGTGKSNLYCRGIDNVNTSNTDIGAKTVSLNETWQRVFVTFVVTDDGDVCPRLERTNDNTNKLIVAGPKLERGSVMTDYSTSPLDNATITALSSISQTVDAIQTTVRGKVDNDVYQSKLTQLSGQITSVVGQVNTFGKRNIVTNSQFQYDYMAGPSWTSNKTDVWYKSDMAWSWVNGYQGICINQPISTNTDTSWYDLFSRKIVIGQDISTPWSGSAYVNVDTVGFSAMLIVEFYNTSGVRIGYKEVYKKSRGLELMKVENAIPPAGTETVCLSFRVHGGGHIAMICPMLNQGDTAAAYTPDITTGEDLQHAYSAINQTNDQISFMVEKNGVINAINVTSEGTKISGSKLHITADTYIDNEIVKNSMIENLSADKIAAGTINAAKINVINLNANNITTGTIKGSRLSINLNTGNVEFQAGRIHSTDNGIDININNKYISVANSNNRVFISGGEIQMIQPTLFSSQSSPYVRISNAGASASWGGATFWARDYFVVTNGANDGNIFTSPMGEEKFAGISGGHSTSGWQVTKIGGAERGVLISGGREFTDGISFSPFIRVGDSGHAGTGLKGSNISMHGNYIYLKSPHSTSHGANAYLAPDGSLVPSNSAAKYKTDIVRTFETGMGDKLLEVPVAHWKDKEEVLSKTLNPSAKNPETYFGMIADDLDDAGLNELVEYDDKGAVRGIQYDRVALALIPLIRNYRDRITELETKVK